MANTYTRDKLIVPITSLMHRSGLWLRGLSSEKPLRSLALALNWGDTPLMGTLAARTKPEYRVGNTIRHWKDLQEELRAMAERLPIDGISPWRHL